MRIHLVSVVHGTHLVLLGHFIEWYKDKVTDFHIAINADDPRPAIDLLASRGIEPALIWRGEFEPLAKSACLARLRARVREDEWCLIADADEFQDWNPREVLSRHGPGYNLVPGIMVDMVSRDGSLTPMSERLPLREQYPNPCYITQGILKGWIAKIVAMKDGLRPHGSLGVGGYHYVDPTCPNIRVLPKIVSVFHHKWDETVLQRLAVRIKTYARLGNVEWLESESFFSYMRQHHKIRFEDYQQFDFDRVEPEMLRAQYGEMLGYAPRLPEIQRLSWQTPHGGEDSHRTR
jgi:hypothetical protein